MDGIGRACEAACTMLPQQLRDALREAMACALATHAADFRAGFGAVILPHALARKYPNAAQESGWQCVFPAAAASIRHRHGTLRHDQRDRKRFA